MDIWITVEGNQKDPCKVFVEYLSIFFKVRRGSAFGKFNMHQCTPTISMDIGRASRGLDRYLPAS